jgi:hypothetical protein
MTRSRSAVPFLALALLLPGMPLLAQDAITLHSVTIEANDDVTVVYSKNFATCAHMRFSDTSCNQFGALTHVQNHFCTQGANVTISVPLSAFVGPFGPGIPVFMHHGNNSGVRSACVTVGCNGAYGPACNGSGGPPVLGSPDVCPPAGGSLQLALTNGLPGSLAILGLGLAQANLPVLGCTLLVDAIGATVFLPLDGTGAAALSIPLPPGINGLSVTAQAFVLDGGGPQGFAATNGLRIRIR